MTRKVNILDLDRLVPLMTKDEQRVVAEAVAAGVWEIEMDAERYDELWASAPLYNADIILRTEEAMRIGVRAPKE